ncbi:MAG: hypothetical protein GX774_11040 [Armatimonadetes bacterium]|nr:hypothetical protein [Armatimonadota bacterium]
MMSWRMMAALLLLVEVGPAAAAPADLDVLLDNVREVVAPRCLVGPVAVFGTRAFPVITGRTGANRLPILAAAHYGKGRVVLSGHEGLYGTLERRDQRRLILNITTWLAGARGKQARVLVVDHPQVASPLAEAGFAVKRIAYDELLPSLKNADVLFLAGGRLTPRDQDKVIEAVARFVDQGGGWCDGIPGWGWLQLNPGLSLADDYGGNRLSARMGLAIADGWLDPTGPEGWLADRSGLTFSHASTALTALERHADGQAKLAKEELAQVSYTLSSACGAVPGDDRVLLPRLRRLVARKRPAVPLPKQPLSLAEPVGRIACVLQHAELRRAPVSRLRAHPAAAGFPGAVPASAPRVTATVTIDTAVPDWHSTGLYAAPGEPVEVQIPDEAVGAGLGLRIGSHTDTIWHHEEWRRFPEISRALPLTRAVTRCGNPFGGILYVTVPRGCRAGRVAVTIKGAVRMPLFVAGETTLEAWRTTIRHYPAPWAELATRKIILTVPAAVVRDLDDPEALMQVWDEGLDAIADLAGIPHERERPERICCDQQISGGYMHAGYPIMTHLDVPPLMVDRERLRTGGAKLCWGFWHELGHNYQSADWTFAGTGETTNNLFSLYCCERVSGEPVLKNAWLNVAERNQTVRDYFARGAKFAEWCRDPGLSLMFYAQLQQAFGWEAYQRLFADYRAANRKDLPTNDDEKRDQFLVRFSRVVGRNLGPFFTAWGIPTSEEARRSIEDLPLWLPPDFQNGLPITTGNGTATTGGRE